MNEPLADQVNWDLIPSDAIARIELHPGSNPVYGRNTLGGAFVVQTKRGFTHPGTLIETWGGSFGRWRSLLQTGGSRGPVDYFLSGNFFTEEGFRDFSRSDVGQVFGKVGYAEGADDLTLSFTYVNNRLTGNGPLPESRLQHDRSAVFTHPDRFVPDLRFVNGEYQRELAPGLLLAANAYGRLLDVEQFNRDVEEDVQADTRQRGWGSAIQLSYQGSLFGLPLTAVVGADYSGARLDHRIAEREDNDADDEMETRTLAHEEPDGFEPATKVRTYTHGGGAFLTATLQPLERLAVTASARVDVTDLRLKDRLAEDDEDLSASGSHRFTRVDPCGGRYLHTHTTPEPLR